MATTSGPAPTFNFSSRPSPVLSVSPPPALDPASFYYSINVTDANGTVLVNTDLPSNTSSYDIPTEATDISVSTLYYSPTGPYEPNVQNISTYVTVNHNPKPIDIRLSMDNTGITANWQQLPQLKHLSLYIYVPDTSIYVPVTNPYVANVSWNIGSSVNSLTIPWSTIDIVSNNVSNNVSNTENRLILSMSSGGVDYYSQAFTTSFSPRKLAIVLKAYEPYPLPPTTTTTTYSTQPPPSTTTTTLSIQVPPKPVLFIPSAVNIQVSADDNGVTAYWPPIPCLYTVDVVRAAETIATIYSVYIADVSKNIPNSYFTNSPNVSSLYLPFVLPGINSIVMGFNYTFRLTFYFNNREYYIYSQEFNPISHPTTTTTTLPPLPPLPPQDALSVLPINNGLIVAWNPTLLNAPTITITNDSGISCGTLLNNSSSYATFTIDNTQDYTIRAEFTDSQGPHAYTVSYTPSFVMLDHTYYNPTTYTLSWQLSTNVNLNYVFYHVTLTDRTTNVVSTYNLYSNSSSFYPEGMYFNNPNTIDIDINYVLPSGEFYTAFTNTFFLMPNNYTLTAAFSNNKNLIAVMPLNSSATPVVVPDNAFNGCTNLRIFNFPIQNIGADAFDGCVSLDDIVLADCVHSSTNPFQTCTSLKSMFISYSETASLNLIPFPTEVFATVPHLDTLFFTGLPSGITLPAFTSSSIRNISLHSPIVSVVSIADSAFADCSGLTTFIVNAPFNNQGSNIFIGSIGASAFAGCKSLDVLSLGTARLPILYGIGVNAFSGDSVRSLELYIKNAPEFYLNETFSDMPSLTSLNIYCTESDISFNFPSNFLQNSTILQHLSLTAYCPGLTFPVMPQTIQTVNIQTTTSLALPSMIIPSNAFSVHRSLTTFNTNYAIEVIRNSAFLGDVSLNTFSSGPIDTIENQAFAGCVNLNFPNIVIRKYIGWGVFYHLPNTQLSLTFANQQDTICDETFADMPHLQNLSINIDTGGILTLSNYFMQSDTAYGVLPPLQELRIIGDISGLTIPPMPASISLISLFTPTPQPKTYCSIAPNAFANNTHLTSFFCNIPVGVVGANAFSNTSGAIDFDCVIVMIDDSAFSGCTQLQTIYFDTVSIINDNAFAGCSNLTTVRIDNVGSIGDNVFNGCSKLASVQLGLFNGGTCNESFSFPTLTNLSINVVNHSYGDAPGINLPLNFCQDAEQLQRLDISGTIASSIDVSGFLNCVNLQQLNLQCASGTFFNSQLYNLDRLEFVTILGASIVAPNFLQGCNSLDSIHFDKLRTNIHYYTLSLVKHIQGFHVYGIIPSHYFHGFTNLVSFICNYDTSIIRVGAFANCTNLTSITLNEGLQEISDFAFANTGLQQVTVPSTVMSLGKSHFLGCLSLTDVTYLCNVSHFCEPVQLITDTYNFLQDVSELTIDISADVASVTKGSDDSLSLSYTVFDPTNTDPSYNGVTTQLDNNKLHVFADVTHYNNRLNYLNQAIQILVDYCITLNLPDASDNDASTILKHYSSQLQICAQQAELSYGPLSGLPTTDIPSYQNPDGSFTGNLVNMHPFSIIIVPFVPLKTDTADPNYFSFLNICQAIRINARPTATLICTTEWEAGGSDVNTWINNINTCIPQLKAALDSANTENNFIQQIYSNQIQHNIPVLQMQLGSLLAPPIMTFETIRVPIKNQLPKQFRMKIPTNIISNWNGLASFVNDSNYDMYYSLSGPSLKLELTDNTIIDISGMMIIDLLFNSDNFNYLTLSRYFTNPLFDTVKPQQVNYKFYGNITNIRSLENKTNCTIDISSQVVYIYDLAFVNYSNATINIHNFDLLKMFDCACQNLTSSTVNINAHTNGVARMGPDVFLNASNISVNTNIHLVNRPNVVLYDFGTATLSDISSIITTVFPNINHDNTRKFKVGTYVVPVDKEYSSPHTLPMITFQSTEDLQEYTILGKPEDWALTFYHQDNYTPGNSGWCIGAALPDNEQRLYMNPTFAPNVISYKGFSWSRDNPLGPAPTVHDMLSRVPQNYAFYRLLPNTYYSPGAQHDRNVAVNIGADQLQAFLPYLISFASIIITTALTAGVGFVIGPEMLAWEAAADITTGVEGVVNITDLTVNMAGLIPQNPSVIKSTDSNRIIVEILGELLGTAAEAVCQGISFLGRSALRVSRSSRILTEVGPETVTATEGVAVASRFTSDNPLRANTTNTAVTYTFPTNVDGPLLRGVVGSAPEDITERVGLGSGLTRNNFSTADPISRLAAGRGLAEGESRALRGLAPGTVRRTQATRLGSAPSTETVAPGSANMTATAGRDMGGVETDITVASETGEVTASVVLTSARPRIHIPKMANRTISIRRIGGIVTSEEDAPTVSLARNLSQQVKESPRTPFFDNTNPTVVREKMRRAIINNYRNLYLEAGEQGPALRLVNPRSNPSDVIAVQLSSMERRYLESIPPSISSHLNMMYGRVDGALQEITNKIIIYRRFVFESALPGFMTLRDAVAAIKQDLLNSISDAVAQVRSFDTYVQSQLTLYDKFSAAAEEAQAAQFTFLRSLKIANIKFNAITVLAALAGGGVLAGLFYGIHLLNTYRMSDPTTTTTTLRPRDIQNTSDSASLQTRSIFSAFEFGAVFGRTLGTLTRSCRAFALWSIDNCTADYLYNTLANNILFNDATPLGPAAIDSALMNITAANNNEVSISTAIDNYNYMNMNDQTIQTYKTQWGPAMGSVDPSNPLLPTSYSSDTVTLNQLASYLLLENLNTLIDTRLINYNSAILMDIEQALYAQSHCFQPLYIPSSNYRSNPQQPPGGTNEQMIAFMNNVKPPVTGANILHFSDFVDRNYGGMSDLIQVYVANGTNFQFPYENSADSGNPCMVNPYCNVLYTLPTHLPKGMVLSNPITPQHNDTNYSTVFLFPTMAAPSSAEAQAAANELAARNYGVDVNIFTLTCNYRRSSHLVDPQAGLGFTAPFLQYMDYSYLLNVKDIAYTQRTSETPNLIFEGAQNVNLNLLEGITSIPAYAYQSTDGNNGYAVSNFNTITLPDTLQTIDQFAFYRTNATTLLFSKQEGSLVLSNSSFSNSNIKTIAVQGDIQQGVYSSAEFIFKDATVVNGTNMNDGTTVTMTGNNSIKIENFKSVTLIPTGGGAPDVFTDSELAIIFLNNFTNLSVNNPSNIDLFDRNVLVWDKPPATIVAYNPAYIGNYSSSMLNIGFSSSTVTTNNVLYLTSAIKPVVVSGSGIEVLPYPNKNNTMQLLSTSQANTISIQNPSSVRSGSSVVNLSSLLNSSTKKPYDPASLQANVEYQYMFAAANAPIITNLNWSVTDVNISYNSSSRFTVSGFSSAVFDTTTATFVNTRDIGSNVTIGPNAFKGATLPYDINALLENAISIGDNAFNGAAPREGAQPIELPATVQSIGSGAFAGFTHPVVIPASVAGNNNIADDAFDASANITLTGDVPTTGEASTAIVSFLQSLGPGATINISPEQNVQLQSALETAGVSAPAVTINVVTITTPDAPVANAGDMKVAATWDVSSSFTSYILRLYQDNSSHLIATKAVQSIGDSSLTYVFDASNGYNYGVTVAGRNLLGNTSSESSISNLVTPNNTDVSGYVTYFDNTDQVLYINWINPTLLPDQGYTISLFDVKNTQVSSNALPQLDAHAAALSDLSSGLFDVVLTARYSTGFKTYSSYVAVNYATSTATHNLLQASVGSWASYTVTEVASQVIRDMCGASVDAQQLVIDSFIQQVTNTNDNAAALTILVATSLLLPSAMNHVKSNIQQALYGLVVSPNVPFDLSPSLFSSVFANIASKYKNNLRTNRLGLIVPDSNNNLVIDLDNSGELILAMLPDISYAVTATFMNATSNSHTMIYRRSDTAGRTILLDNTSIINLNDSIPFSFGGLTKNFVINMVGCPGGASEDSNQQSTTTTSTQPTTSTTTQPTTSTTTQPTTSTTSQSTTSTTTQPTTTTTTQAGNIPCFPTGTPILTPSGYMSVENLRTGDIVTTADGRSVPVTIYSVNVANTTKQTAPYVIPAHSFGRNSPSAELRLSPLHAFQIRKGVWQNAAMSANKNVYQYAVGEPMTYYHVECPNFFTDNLVTNGCIVESFAGKQVVDTKSLYRYNERLGGFTRKTKAGEKKTLRA